MQHLLSGTLPELRIHPIRKRIRAAVGDTVVADTRSALVVWEPRRVVPCYAVPSPTSGPSCCRRHPCEARENAVLMGRGGPPVLDPAPRSACTPVPAAR